MTNVNLRGTNLAGGDTAYTDWVGSTPKDGKNYMFVTNQDIDYLISKGCNAFRLLFSWEAIQPTMYGTLPSSIADHANYYTQFKSRVDYITSKGATCLIDCHAGIDADFAAYYGAKVGTTYNNNPVTDLLSNLWWNLANVFKSNAKVMFGIMNEPCNMSTMVWFAAAQKIITAIRSTGSTNKIMMPGNGFTAASSWVTTPYSETGVPPRSNAYGWLNAGGVGIKLSDPANNLAMQVHLYADQNAGGGAIDVVNGTILADRVKVAVDWARANNVQVFVAEVGLAGGVPNAQAAWDSFVAYCNANSDVVIGYTFWSYGPPSWWGGYKFSLCPTSAYTVDSSTMSMVKAAFAAGPAPVPVPVPVPSPTPAYTPDQPFTTTTNGAPNWVIVPKAYNKAVAFPLFVWLHGCGGQSKYDVSMVSTQNWISLAVGGREGLCWQDVDTGGKKILDAIADLRTKFNIDPKRIYLGGYSSGGDIGYPLVFRNANLFAGAVFENTAPGSKGFPAAPNASWKLNIAHLAHLQDTTYPIAGARTDSAKLKALGFPVTLIEKEGTHYDADSGSSGTSYDLKTFLLPLATWTQGSTPPVPVPTPDPQIAVLQAQVADLTAKLKTSSDANTQYVQQVTALTTANGLLTSDLASANSNIAALNNILNQVKALVL